MSKIAATSILIVLAAILLAGCTGSTNTTTPTPTPTAIPTPVATDHGIVSPQAPATVTPTPVVAPNRTTEVQVRTITALCNVQFKVYTDKVEVKYLNGLGNLSVNSSNMGGSGAQGGYLKEPGDIITLGYNSTIQNASIFVYQPTDNGMTYGGSTYYPGTGEAKVG